MTSMNKETQMNLKLLVNLGLTAAALFVCFTVWLIAANFLAIMNGVM